MATSAVRSPSVRRSSITPSSLASTPSPLAKGGATARSAALNRRGSVASKPSSIASNVEADSATKSGLAASLKKETEEKEEVGQTSNEVVAIKLTNHSSALAPHPASKQGPKYL